MAAPNHIGSTAARWVAVLVVAVTLCMLSLSEESSAAPKKKKVAQGPKMPITPHRKWTSLFLGKASSSTTITGLQRWHLASSEELRFVGPDPGHPFRLGHFQHDGRWGVKGGQLQRISGRNTAMIVGNGEDFELEAVCNAQGLGGWFLLFGWKEGNGYTLYNPTLKVSGSPWIFAEIKNGVGDTAGQHEVNRYHWRGYQRMNLQVDDSKLSLKIGKTTIVKDHDLPNYQAGDIMIGSYDTRYGPKVVKIQKLGIRLPARKKPGKK